MDKAVRERANQYGIGTLFDIEAFSLLSGIRVETLNEFKSIKELQANYKMLEVTKLQSQKLEAFFELCQRVGRQSLGEVSKFIGGTRAKSEKWNLVLNGCDKDHTLIVDKVTTYPDFKVEGKERYI